MDHNHYRFANRELIHGSSPLSKRVSVADFIDDVDIEDNSYDLEQKSLSILRFSDKTFKNSPSRLYSKYIKTKSISTTQSHIAPATEGRYYDDYRQDGKVKSDSFHYFKNESTGQNKENSLMLSSDDDFGSATDDDNYSVANTTIIGYEDGKDMENIKSSPSTFAERMEVDKMDNPFLTSKDSPRKPTMFDNETLQINKDDVSLEKYPTSLNVHNLSPKKTLENKNIAKEDNFGTPIGKNYSSESTLHTASPEFISLSTQKNYLQESPSKNIERFKSLLKSKFDEIVRENSPVKDKNASLFLSKDNSIFKEPFWKKQENLDRINDLAIAAESNFKHEDLDKLAKDFRIEYEKLGLHRGTSLDIDDYIFLGNSRPANSLDKFKYEPNYLSSNPLFFLKKNVKPSYDLIFWLKTIFLQIIIAIFLVEIYVYSAFKLSPEGLNKFETRDTTIIDILNKAVGQSAYYASERIQESLYQLKSRTHIDYDFNEQSRNLLDITGLGWTANKWLDHHDANLNIDKCLAIEVRDYNPIQFAGKVLCMVHINSHLLIDKLSYFKKDINSKTPPNVPNFKKLRLYIKY